MYLGARFYSLIKVVKPAEKHVVITMNWDSNKGETFDCARISMDFTVTALPGEDTLKGPDHHYHHHHPHRTGKCLAEERPFGSTTCGPCWHCLHAGLHL